MKRNVIILTFLLTIVLVSFGQSTDTFVSSCSVTAGADAKYLKDFRVQLGKAAAQSDFRYKANMSLWKNTKYRFVLCNSDDSAGKLILNIKDDTDKVVFSSFDPKTGKSYLSIDYVCNKSGIFQLCYDFTDQQQGSAVCVVSIVK
jgi:hypothetical protein